MREGGEAGRVRPFENRIHIALPEERSYDVLLIRKIFREIFNTLEFITNLFAV